LLLRDVQSSKIEEGSTITKSVPGKENNEGTIEKPFYGRGWNKGIVSTQVLIKGKSDRGRLKLRFEQITRR